MTDSAIPARVAIAQSVATPTPLTVRMQRTSGDGSWEDVGPATALADIQSVEILPGDRIVVEHA